MNFYMLTAACVVMIGYLAFGDFFVANIASTPENVLSEVGRGLRVAVEGAASFVFRAVGA